MVGRDGGEAASDLLGLDAPEWVQRDVPLTLKARLGVPIRLAVADEIDRPLQDEPSRSSAMSGAPGFFMPTTW